MSNNPLSPIRRTATIVGMLALVSIIFAGCIAVGGTDNYQAPTLGRQLQDLKVAHDAGAVSDTEYQDAKTKLINGEYNRRR